MAYQPPALRGQNKGNCDEHRTDTDIAHLTLGFMHAGLDQVGNGPVAQSEHLHDETSARSDQNDPNNATFGSPRSDTTVTPYSGGVALPLIGRLDSISNGSQMSPSAALPSPHMATGLPNTGGFASNSRFFNGGSPRWTTANATPVTQSTYQNEALERRNNLPPFGGPGSLLSLYPSGNPWTSPTYGGSFSAISGMAPRRLEDVGRFMNASTNPVPPRSVEHLSSPPILPMTPPQVADPRDTQDHEAKAELQFMLSMAKKHGFNIVPAPIATQEAQPIATISGSALDATSPRPAPVILHRLSPVETEYDDDHEHEDSRSALRNRRGRGNSVLGGGLTERGFNRERGESASRGGRGRGGPVRYQPPGGPRAFNRVREPLENLSRIWKSPEVVLQEEWTRVRNSMRRLFPQSEIAKWKFEDYKKHKEATEAHATAMKERAEALGKIKMPKVILKPQDGTMNILAEAERIANDHFPLLGETYEQHVLRNQGRDILMFPCPDDTSYVLSSKTIWCVNWKNGKEEIADWPSIAELKWEGDDRAKTNVGRFLPLPRERGAPGMPWNQLEVVKQHGLDRVWLPPTEEDIIAPVDEIPEELKNTFVLPEIWDAIEDSVNN
ncbi:hypothetical protein P154DRAFT_352793 [Amniculicola lignicola CBS 123094]|uniref:Uncharacterized protein n=1 Tax=Amniculicola lignicola CBS 123094 TaxID=1392246 RepID=A0A6A5WVD2_9PLEO|nr:hypothetical protein P154DRAFT_352793 [Amniculicola lignicola CBS 123094]